jgi:hypothetical protein
MFYWGGLFDFNTSEEKKEDNFEINKKKQNDTKNAIEELKKMLKKQTTE